MIMDTTKSDDRRANTNEKTQSTIPAASQSYMHHIGKEPLAYRNVGQQLELAASQFGSTEAIVSCHEAKRYTFRSLLAEVDRVAAGLLKLGLQRGDAVGIWAPNYIQWYLSMMGAARAGLTSVGINPAFQGPEMEYCLKKVDIKAILATESFKTQNYYEIVRDICPEMADSEAGKIRSDKFPHLRAVIIDSKQSLKGALRFDELLDLSNASEQEEITKLQREIQPESPCNVQFTSGTTGNPKAAVLSHYNFVNNGIHVGSRNELDGERICVQVPLFHAFGVGITIMAAMSKGATLVLPSAGFSPKDSLQAIVEEKCTVIHGTPTMYVDLVVAQRKEQLPLGKIKKAITGGAPVSPQLILDVKQVLGVEAMHSVYGLTESTAVIFQSLPGEEDDRVLHSVGHLTDHIEAKIIDEKGCVVPLGQPGELCVRGYLTMLGYHGDEEKTREIISADNWMRTGDQFVMEADGYGRIVGRLKEMVIRGGENIFPKEVEDFINTHPQVVETHVIGVPDERLGEELCAFVRLHHDVDPKTFTKESLREYAKGKIAHFKVPRYVVPVDAFPKTTSGKIQKFKLLKKFEDSFHTQKSKSQSQAVRA
ncbi:medium-chain acyl-CoA ligase ACSF2, mitochondrial isoform X2 [Drosophila grimshawi]|uniref:medium-chain acyl-CoA ligase ACSF2, mitochondrial isoform X2 n=1 Tax=Drosophila grimshawi TaxID=7222 RepID=UPI000C86FDA1|nr:medium-chain acyl-CoA ligase ACSF2, mitochondrial isoform X2 [Drosophila grimshawi]